MRDIMVVQQKCMISMKRLDTNTSLYGYTKVEVTKPINGRNHFV